MTNQLRQTRRARRMAMAELSVKANVSVSVLCATEKYGYLPGAVLRDRIADALGTTVEDIWPSTGDQDLGGRREREFSGACAAS